MGRGTPAMPVPGSLHYDHPALGQEMVPVYLTVPFATISEDLPDPRSDFPSDLNHPEVPSARLSHINRRPVQVP